MEWKRIIRSDSETSRTCEIASFLEIVVALKRAVLVKMLVGLLRSGILGDGLGALADCVLGQLPWKEKTHRSLDFAAGDGRLLVVERKTRGF